MTAKQVKRKVNKKLSDNQKLFASAINYDALNKALNDPQFIAIIKKIRL